MLSFVGRSVWGSSFADLRCTNWPAFAGVAVLVMSQVATWNASGLVLLRESAWSSRGVGPWHSGRYSCTSNPLSRAGGEAIAS